nr:helix-turn-helix transcriptional regulator [Roseospira visakhapatnamensis]
MNDDAAGRKGAPDPVDVYVGRRLRKQRTLLKLSQEQLARAVGVTFQQIQKYERGSNRISASRLYDIAKVLGVPINFFFDHIEDEIDGRPEAHIDGLAEPPSPTYAQSDLTRSETLDLVAAYWKLPTDDIRRKALALLRSMSGLKDKKGEPIPDAPETTDSGNDDEG